MKRCKKEQEIQNETKDDERGRGLPQNETKNDERGRGLPI